MYRESATPDRAESPPEELVYVAEDRDRRNGSSIAMFQLFAVPFISGMIVSYAINPTAGFAAIVVTGVGLVWWWKRGPRRHGVILRVVDGELRVITQQAPKVDLCLPLRDLVNVTLDTKTIQRVQEGNSPIPAMRFLDAKVGPDVDTSRIVLLGRGGKSYPLSKAYLPNMDATEWFGKIRVFLRKHGWVPSDEREEEVDESIDSQPEVENGVNDQRDL